MMKTLSQAGRWLLYVVVIGLGLVIVGTQRERIVELVRIRPVLVPLMMALLSVLTGLAVYWRAHNPESWRQYRDAAVMSLVAMASLTAGLYLISAATHYADESLKLSAAWAAMGWALGYFACGFVVGFLFGVPRVLQGEGPGGGATPPGATAVTSPSGYRQLVNTNLEQISDWLTKIIVGLGLVEMKQMPGRIHRAAEWMAQSLTSKQGPELQQAASFACGFILYFAVVGFLAGYLLTRLYLSGAFGRADQGHIPTVTGPPTFVPAFAPAGGGGPTTTDARRIRAYWRPGGTVNHANEQGLNQWLSKKGIDASLVKFLEEPQYAAQRSEMIKELGIA